MHHFEQALSQAFALVPVGEDREADPQSAGGGNGVKSYGFEHVGAVASGVAGASGADDDVPVVQELHHVCFVERSSSRVQEAGADDVVDAGCVFAVDDDPSRLCLFFEFGDDPVSLVFDVSVLMLAGG